MPTTEQLLDKGLEHHQAGRLAEAARLYQEILRVNPLHADALHLLGLVYHQQGKHEAALENISRALGVKPSSKVFWGNLSAVYHALGRHREAVDAAGQTLRLHPDDASAHNNLGIALLAQGRLDDAAASLQQALRLRPDHSLAHNNLGNVLVEQGKLEEAVCCFQKALEINPNYAEAHSNLGVVLRQQGELDEAFRRFQKALEINPNYAEAHSNLGVVLRQQGKPDEAVCCFQKALEINPDYADAHKNLGIVLLQLGDFEAGWSQYEWRWRTREEKFKPRSFTQPPWDGQPLEGRSLLLHAEQGLGDTLQFVRYAPLVRQRGCRVILECQKPLRTLLKSCPGIDHLVARGEELPPFDCHVPLFSLPRLLGTQVGNIPANVPYLFAREDLVRHWQDRLSACPGFKVGICWQGSPTYRSDRQRSVALAHFAALAEVPGIELISLQKGAGTEQLATVRFPVRCLGGDLDEANGAFMDTAAVMKNLDLVVTTDTAVAHLAGALAVPVWVALAKVPDWRWLLGREDSPWYPTMRLFRQDKAGDWELVFRRMQNALRERLATRGDSLPQGAAPEPPAARLAGGLTVEISPGELLDKITILEIKSERIADSAKLSNVRLELTKLTAVRDREVVASAELTRLAAELKEVNEALWRIEDDIRDCERRQDFGPVFIELARSVYRQNDRRAALKRRINELLGSRIIEEKSYRSWEA